MDDIADTVSNLKKNIAVRDALERAAIKFITELSPKNQSDYAIPGVHGAASMIHTQMMKHLEASRADAIMICNELIMQDAERLREEGNRIITAEANRTTKADG